MAAIDRGCVDKAMRSARYKTTEQRLRQSSLFLDRVNLSDRFQVTWEQHRLVKREEMLCNLLQLERGGLAISQDCFNTITTLRHCVLMDKRVYEGNRGYNKEWAVKCVDQISARLKDVQQRWTGMRQDEEYMRRHPFVGMTILYIWQDIRNLIAQFRHSENTPSLRPGPVAVAILRTIRISLCHFLWYQIFCGNAFDTLDYCTREVWHNVFPGVLYVSQEDFIAPFLSYCVGGMWPDLAVPEANAFRKATRLVNSHYRYGGNYDRLKDTDKFLSNVLTRIVWSLDSDGDGLITMLDMDLLMLDWAPPGRKIIRAPPSAKQLGYLLFHRQMKTRQRAHVTFTVKVHQHGMSVNKGNDARRGGALGDLLETYSTSDEFNGWVQVVKHDEERVVQAAGVMKADMLRNVVKQPGVFICQDAIARFRTAFADAQANFKKMISSLI